ncbi:FAD-dependent oxidoreductase [Aestuariispira insulae]|uniref:Glycine/D-amino acid oxidase-like deaminating enzyme n=1 Tax=Aestuariispira insulae TaxID=1461337 RepID=A0A3D9HRA1_9PROT|nr:FAD-dependent oxidoreductase [Aestuariispira insulae]RED52037.1 glycine/D-amino acid oxidase-like deaminating enzyme [Aestuariispira insulae]
MKICVLGGGVVGTTAAWMLSEAGHDIVLVEQSKRMAAATSHANASLLTPGHSMAWNSPRAPIDFLKSWLDRDPVMKMRLKSLWKSFPWIWHFLRRCPPQAVERLNGLLLRLSLESTEKTEALTQSLGLDVSLDSKGLLYWHGSEAGLEQDRKHADWVSRQGLDARIISADEVLRLQPALADRRNPVVGGYYVREDRVADARALTHQLGIQLLLHGQEILCEHELQGFVKEGGRICAVRTNRGEIEADAFVLALGPWTGQALRQLKVGFPINPAKGYSMTLSLHEEVAPLQISGMDADEYVTFAMLGDRLRVTSYAHFDGFDLSTPEGRFARHRRAVDDNFPGLVDWTAETKKWCGLRPMSPDGLPTIDRVPGHDNLWLNAGHGYLGWTLAVLSAEMLRDRMDGVTGATPDGLGWRW